MIKYTVSYEDFNGKKIDEDLYFHLRKMDIVDLEVTEGISVSERVEKITGADSALDVKELLKGFVLSAYGVRTEDGKFLKSNKIREDFESSEAYSEIMWRLLTHPTDMADFFNNLIPKEIMEDAIKVLESKRKNASKEEPQDIAPLNTEKTEETPDISPEPEPKDTPKALTDMSPEELEAYVQQLNEERRAAQE